MLDGCSSLVTIELSNNIESIGAYAFANCSTLPEIRIPISVEQIGSHAFVGCSALTIYAEADSQPIGWHADFNQITALLYGIICQIMMKWLF